MATKDRIYSADDVIGGTYRVIRVMEGGLGVVYAVEDNEGNRLVLKSPKRQLDEESSKSFRAEAETWVRLGCHPNIVNAFWVNDVAGLLFVGAELVEADEAGCVSLRDVLRFGVLRPRTVAAWAVHFCFGMEHAVSRGLVAHRDIKPENLLIGASKQLRITDFGLANAFAGKLAGSTIERVKVGDWNTVGGPLSGTPHYMAPEQWLGERQDFSTDAYAFGVVLFEMCFGVNPFDASDINEMARRHLSERVEIPDCVFSSVIRRCLEKEAEARFSTPRKLFEALSVICKANALALPQRPKETDKHVDELFALCTLLQVKQKYPEALKIAKELIQTEPERARNWTELGRIHLQLNNLKEAKASTERALSLDETRSAAWNNLGVIFNRLGQWKAAVAAFDRAIDCDPTNTGALANAADALRNDNRAGEAILRLRRAATLGPDKFQTWLLLGDILTGIGNRAEALVALHKAKTLAPPELQAVADHYRSVAEKIPNELSATALIEAGDLEIAERKLIAEIKQSPTQISNWYNLGLIYFKQRRWHEAKDCFSQVYRLDSKNGFAVCRIIEISSFLEDISSVEEWCDVLAGMPNGKIASIAFRARAMANCDKFQEAKTLIFDAVRQYPSEPDILIACGDVMMWYPTVAMFMENACDVYGRAIEILKTQWESVHRQREIEDRLRIALHYRQKCREEYMSSKT